MDFQSNPPNFDPYIRQVRRRKHQSRPPMILRKNVIFSELKATVSLLVGMRATEFWVVFDPEFIAFETEEEHEKREIKLSSGETAYRLLGSEMVTMIESEKIGFDWTDFVIERDVALDETGRFTCYVQCVDALVWYVLSEDEAMINFLSSQGFSAHDSASLSFPRRSLAAI